MEKFNCICQTLDSCKNLQFNTLPAADISEPDKTTLINVGKVMIIIHYPQIKNKSWSIEEEDKYYNVYVSYPSRTIIDDKQIDLIKLVNTLLIKRIWIQPEKDSLLLCASVWKSSERIPIDVQDLYIIQRTLRDTNNKRFKLETGTGKNDNNN